jgi:hypothetical protein
LEFASEPAPNRRLRYADVGSDLAGRVVADSNVFVEFAQRCFRVGLTHCLGRSEIRSGDARRFKRFFQCPLSFDNALSTSVFSLLPIIWLDSLKYSQV